MGRLALLVALALVACLDAPESGVAPPPGDDSGSASQACDDAFGGAPGYKLCAQSEAVCEFYTESAGQDCIVICGEFDAECVGAWDADAPDLCVQTNEDDCTGQRGDIVCVCTRPP